MTDLAGDISGVVGTGLTLGMGAVALNAASNVMMGASENMMGKKKKKKSKKR